MDRGRPAELQHPLPRASVRVGGDKFDDAITNYVRRNYGILIGEATSEKIKHEIGTAYPGKDLLEIEVKGRNLSEGIPRSFSLNSNEILEALQEPLQGIVGAVKAALEQTPPELGADVAERGIVLTGGGAMLRDLDKLLMEETGLPVVIADEGEERFREYAADLFAVLDELTEGADLVILGAASRIATRSPPGTTGAARRPPTGNAQPLG